MTHARPRVLLLYTGGTIGMTEHPDSGALVPLDFDNLEALLPELRRLEVDLEVMELPAQDSSNIGPTNWLQMANTVKQAYAHFDGFVLLHGTDTMAYTASALSFLFENLGKPVVVTGSQLPLGKLRTDGVENMITAIQIAADRHVQEVCVYFGSKLYRGNRTHKHNTEHFDAIDSPNLAPLAEAGIHLRYNDAELITADTQQFKVHSQLDARVGLVKFYPGMPTSLLQAQLSSEAVQVVVLETFGSGNVPSDPGTLDALTRAVDSGKWLVNITQCATGFVEQGLYETSSALDKLGITPGADLTTEAAITKSMWLLTWCKTHVEFERAFLHSHRGELTNFSVLK